MIRAAWMAGAIPYRQGVTAPEEKMRNWLFYRDTSGDIVVEQDCHNFDVVNWFMGAHPVSVAGYGGRLSYQVGDIMDYLACTFRFPGGIVFSYAANQFSTRGYRDVFENAAFSAVETMYTAIMARTAIYTGREVTWDEMQRT